MSFALDFRNKRVKSEGRPRGQIVAGEAAEQGFAVPKARKDANTRVNRRRVFAALLIAGLVLAVFNSAGLVQYARGFSGDAVSARLIDVSESWHRMMDSSQATRIVATIRDAVSAVRDASWRDVAAPFTGKAEPPAPRDLARPARPEGGTMTSIPSRYGGAPATPLKRGTNDKSG